MYGISFEQWVFMFFIFTVIGWIHETFVESLYHKKFVNRGSLHGPYIPIYGFGGCAMIVFVCPFKDNGFFAFLSGLICCTVLEYFTGWLMETLFHRQFWDYSMMKLTYKNRISLLSSLCWGFMSLFMLYMLFPFMQWFCGIIGSKAMIVFDCVMTMVFAVDIIFTVKRDVGWRNIAKKLSPEQIKAALQKKRSQVGNIFGHFTAALRRESIAAKKDNRNKAKKSKTADSNGTGFETGSNTDSEINETPNLNKNGESE